MPADDLILYAAGGLLGGLVATVVVGLAVGAIAWVGRMLPCGWREDSWRDAE